MVGAPSAADAIARARRLPRLRVGLHLVLTDGEPVLPATQVPDLVGADGRFRNDMARLGAAIFLRPAVRRQLAAEIEAQFSAFAASGLALDHVNAHKHFHVHPTIAGLLVEIGARFGLRAVRVPNEPHALLARIDAATPAVDAMLPPCAALLRRRLRKARLAAPDRVFGIAWSGAMTTDRVAALLRQLPDGCSELYAHPATDDAFVGAEPGYAYAGELAALTSTAAHEALRESGARLSTFADLARP